MFFLCFPKLISFKFFFSTYKSKKRLIRSDLDTHYWPFCKIHGKEHVPERFLLTQIICADILKELANDVHDIKRKLGLKMDCYCCKTETTPTKNKKNVNKNNDAIKEIPAIENNIVPQIKIEPSNHPEPKSSYVDQLKECPVCKQTFKNLKCLNRGIHLIGHFFKDLNHDIPQESPWKCPVCNEERLDQNALILHYSLDHGELEKHIKNYVAKKYSVKNIRLEADDAKRYVLRTYAKKVSKIGPKIIFDKSCSI